MGRFLMLACALLATIRAQQAETEFHGTVVDSDGKPVAEARVDTYWAVVDGKLSPRAGTRTDAEGAFKIRVHCTPNRPTPIMAVDKSGTLGAALPLDPDHPEVKLTLVPMVKVHGETTSTELDAPIERCFVSVFHPKATLALVGIDSAKKFSLLLPPGDYRLTYYAADCVGTAKNASVAADSKEVDFGTVNLAPTVLARLYGKAPPKWSVSDARGVEKTVELTDFKGKWVLMEFWGYW